GESVSLVDICVNIGAGSWLLFLSLFQITLFLKNLWFIRSLNDLEPILLSGFLSNNLIIKSLASLSSFSWSINLSILPLHIVLHTSSLLPINGGSPTIK